MDIVSIFIKIKHILLQLTTENIIEKFNFLNPHVFITDWRLMAIFIFMVILLLSLRMIKTLTFLLGCITLWIVGYYYLPQIETNIELGNMIVVILTSIVVISIWIYIFFIKE